jgi:HK97 gp10 family phage protein
MSDMGVSIKIPASLQAVIAANITAKLQENLVAAATDLMLAARANAPVDTGHLQRNIHAVLPGQQDAGTPEVEAIPGLLAGPGQAFVIAKTHRSGDKNGTTERDRGDYAFYQEFGPASAADPNGRHFMLKAIEEVDGKYPGVKIGDIVAG